MKDLINSNIQKSHCAHQRLWSQLLWISLLHTRRRIENIVCKALMQEHINIPLLKIFPAEINVFVLELTHWVHNQITCKDTVASMTDGCRIGKSKARQGPAFFSGRTFSNTNIPSRPLDFPPSVNDKTGPAYACDLSKFSCRSPGEVADSVRG